MMLAQPLAGGIEQLNEKYLSTAGGEKENLIKPIAIC